jgi:hypothetical protein
VIEHSFSRFYDRNLMANGIDQLPELGRLIIMKINGGLHNLLQLSDAHVDTGDARSVKK